MENRNSYKNTVPRNTVPRNTFPKNTFPKNIIPRNNVPKNSLFTSKNSTENKTKILLITGGSIVLLIIVIYLIICVVHYYSSNCYETKNFFSYIFDFSDSNVCIHETDPTPPPPKPSEPSLNILPLFEKKEVYHIENQDYTYDQSKCKCESYGGKLATKDQITDAYNNGANWCNYGWSEGQNAYYPVQQCTWDEINSKNEHLPKKSRQFCGMPGINGGYFANPNLKFGVNCYGVKPSGKITKANKPYCPPMNFCKLEQNYEASHRLDSDEIAPFNNDIWNMN